MKEEELPLDTLFTVDNSNLDFVLKEACKNSPLIMWAHDSKHILACFRGCFVLKNGKYKFTFGELIKFFDKIQNKLVNESLETLVKEDVVDLYVDEAGEIVYKLKDEYKDII